MNQNLPKSVNLKVNYEPSENELNFNKRLTKSELKLN